MHFIHEATGSIASFAAYVIAGTGLILYFFKYVRKVYQFDRKLAVKAHLYMTLLLFLAAAGHYYSTDKSNFFVMTGLAGFALVALTGFTLRIKKVKAKYFKKVVTAKVIILLLTASFLFVGHTTFEKDHGNEHDAKAPVIINNG